MEAHVLLKYLMAIANIGANQNYTMVATQKQHTAAAQNARFDKGYRLHVFASLAFRRFF
jgi:hypothetical protein